MKKACEETARGFRNRERKSTNVNRKLYFDSKWIVADIFSIWFRRLGGGGVGCVRGTCNI